MKLGPKRGSLWDKVSSRRFLLILALFTLALSLFVPLTHALVSLNPGNSPTSTASATQYTSQEKVFYANGYWWVFWGSAAGTNGIYYESSANGVTWSTPTTFTNPPLSGVSISSGTTTSATNKILTDTHAAWTASEWVGNCYLTYLSGPAKGQSLVITANTATTITTAAFSPAPTAGGGDSFAITLNPNGGTEFDAYLVGNSLYYVVAPKTTAVANNNFWWGVATLQATGTVAFTQQDAVHSLAATRIGTTAARASITVDGNGYITTAVTTSNAGGTTFYIDLFQCQGTVALCASTTTNVAPWYTAEYTLATGAVGDLTTPSLIPLSAGTTYYDALVFDNAASTGGAAGYGAMEVYIGTSTPLSFPMPGAATCSPASQFYNDVNFGATGSGNTVYVINSYFGGGTYSFSCPAGGPVSVEDPISATGYIASLGMYGTELIAVYPTGNNIQTFTSTTAGASWNVAGCSAAAPCVAQNTESGAYGLAAPSQVDVTPVAYNIGGQNFMGVTWMDGNVLRFAVLSLTNFPVTVTIAMNEYQTPLQTPWYPLNPSNEFQISYTSCAAVGCAGSAASDEYGSCSATIGNCNTATPAYVCPAGATTGATAGCYIIITNVQSYSQVTVAAKSSSSTATEQWCVQISTNVGGTCQTTTIGASDGIPPQNNIGGTLTNNFVNLQYFDAFAEPSCYAVAPNAASGTTTGGTTNTVLQDSNAAWTAGQWVGDYLSYTSGPAACQSLVITANTKTTITTAAFSPVPTGTGGNTFLINIPAGTGCPPRQATMNVIGIATSANGGVNNPTANLQTSSFSPTTKCSGYASPASMTYWMLKNGTDFASASVTGAASDQWAANPSNLAWTIVSANQINPDIVYYHQYINLFTIKSGGVQQFDGTGSFVLYGTQYGQFKIAVATYTPNGVGSYSADLWTDAATSVYFPPAYIGAGYRWQICPTGICAPGWHMYANGTSSWRINSGVGLNSTTSAGYGVTYFKQFSQILAYGVSDSSTMPVNPPPISYTAFGVAKNPNLNTTSSNVWMDAATTASVVQTYCTGPCGSATERWYTQEPLIGAGPNRGWTISATNVITNPSIIWYHQFSQALVYKTSDGSAVFGAPASVTITYYYLGVQSPHPLNTTSSVDWLDAAKLAFVNDPIVGALPTEQWTVQPATSSWSSISVANEVSNPIVYNHQFQVTFLMNPPGTGSIEANSVVVVLSSPIWENAGAAGTFPIVANPIPGYSFSRWTETGSITIAVPGSASTTATVTGSGTITATTSIVTGLGFVEQNIALTGPLWSVVVTAPSPIPNPGLSGCVLDAGLTYTCSSNSQDIIITTAPLGRYTYTIPSPQPWSAGTQYVYTGAAPSPVTLTVAQPTASVSVPFSVIYQLTMVSNPIGAGTIVANPTNSPGAPVGWYFANVEPIMTEAPTGTDAFIDWTGFSCSPNCANPSVGITMIAPETAVANFKVPLSMVFSSTSASASVGGQVQVTITVIGGSGTVTMTTSAPLPSGIAVTFAPSSFPATASPGATVTMTITVAPTVVDGGYTFTVYATDSTPQQISQVFVLTVISPSPSSVGRTTSAYAITFPSQTSTFFGPSGAPQAQWFVFYSDGINLVYRVSLDGIGQSWGLSSNAPSAPGAVEGYSFSVTIDGDNVFLAYISPNFPSSFVVDSGVIKPSCALPSEPEGICWGPAQTVLLKSPATYAAGSPSILVDDNATAGCSAGSPCVWVSVPAIASSNLEWHIQVFQSSPGGSFASENEVDIPMNQIFTGGVSSAHGQLLDLSGNMALMGAIGNTPAYPTVTIVNRITMAALTYCPGGQLLLTGLCPSPPSGWSSPAVKFVEQQSSGVAVGDNIYVAGQALVSGAYPAEFFTFTYSPDGVIACGGIDGCFSSPSQIIHINTILPNQWVDNSWHISLAYVPSQNALVLSWGVNGQLYITQSTDFGQTWPGTPISLSLPNNLVNGLTAITYGNTVGLVWIEQISAKLWQVTFALV